MAQTRSTNSEDEKDLLRVKASSDPSKLASAIAYQIYDGKSPTLRAIGAGAVNQSVKAIAIARSFAAARGFDLICIPGFATVTMPEGDVSAIVLRVSAKEA